MSFSLARTIRPAASTVWRPALSPFISVRFLSKKSDSEPLDDVPPKKLSSIKNGSKLEPEKKTSRSKKSKTTKFIPMSKLPKPPPEITKMPVEQLYAKVGMTDLPKPRVVSVNKHDYKFEIPSKYVRKRAIRPGPISPFEPSRNFFDFRPESGPPAVQHPLQESITGMFAANPNMDGLDVEYLWRTYPEGQSFGHSPFGEDFSFDGFKRWEKIQEERSRERKDLLDFSQEEVAEFKAIWHHSLSFFRRSKMKSKKESDSELKTESKPEADSELKAEAKPELKAEGKTEGETEAHSTTTEVKANDTKTKKAGGRRKLDRGLLRRFRKYRDNLLEDE